MCIGKNWTVFWAMQLFLGVASSVWMVSTSDMAPKVSQAELIAKPSNTTTSLTNQIITCLGGGDLDRYNLGNTLVHEVAHWLGLVHTFDGGCTTSDGIFDTPAEKEPNYGCNTSDVRDTCPGDGVDPIHNFLDYSDDRCMFHFTEGQVRMMQASYDVFRLGNVEELEEITLSNGVESEVTFIGPRQRQVFSLETTANSVTCSVSSADGSPSFALKWGRPPSFNLLFDACGSGIFQSKSCTARFGLGRTTLYASVRATGQRPVEHATIVCTENN